MKIRNSLKSLKDRHRQDDPRIQYLQERAEAGVGAAPWLVELAHYEWVELALDLSEASTDDTPHDPAGDLLDGVPVPSPLAWPLAYAWPVHRLSPEHQPTEPPALPTLLLVQRDGSTSVFSHYPKAQPQA